MDVTTNAYITTASMELTQPEHEYVDLGLPSGTLWITCNVGACTLEEYGDYFAMGETETKRDLYTCTDRTAPIRRAYLVVGMSNEDPLYAEPHVWWCKRTSEHEKR